MSTRSDTSLTGERTGWEGTAAMLLRRGVPSRRSDRSIAPPENALPQAIKKPALDALAPLLKDQSCKIRVASSFGDCHAPTSGVSCARPLRTAGVRGNGDAWDPGV